MTRSVAYRESAAAEFLTLPKAEQRVLKDALKAIAARFPDTPPGLDVEKVRGTDTLWRFAFGEYRCVFRMEKEKLIVFAIGLRPGFYLRFGED